MNLKLNRMNLLAGAFAGVLGSAAMVEAHSIIVDLAPGVPGFQTAVAVLPGTLIVADVHLVDDGVTAITGYGLATNFNDTPGTLAWAPPTVAGPAAGLMPGPVDLFGGGAVVPGLPLVAGGIPAFGLGPGGPFTATDGGAGYYDFGGVGWAMPGLGGTVILETITFMAIGPVGSVTDVAPLGILMPGAPGGGPGVPPPVAAPGVEFYDAAAGTYAAVGFAPGANPLFPLGTPAIMPGTVGIIPEPSSALLGVTALGLFLGRRRRS